MGIKREREMSSGNNVIFSSGSKYCLSDQIHKGYEKIRQLNFLPRVEIGPCNSVPSCSLEI